MFHVAAFALAPLSVIKHRIEKQRIARFHIGRMQLRPNI